MSRAANEELYLVLQGRAVFELDGERVDAPAGTFVFARPGVKRTAFAGGARDDDRRARRHSREESTSRTAGSSGRR